MKPSLEIEVIADYVRHIERYPEANRSGALVLRDDMRCSPLYVHEHFSARTLQIPRLYAPETIQRFEQIVRTSYAIFVKVIDEYVRNAEYRQFFHLPPWLEELIVSAPLCASPLPMARFDIFYNEDSGDFSFCEVNTDGTSAMNEDRILGELYMDNPAHQQVVRRWKLEQFELFDSWVRCFLDMYRQTTGKEEMPHIAIIDFLDNATVREFKEFARRFQRAGATCEICDIRELRFWEGRLYSEWGPIDAVYRRAVTADIIKHRDELAPFFNAVRARAFFMAGDLRTQVIHTKLLFYALGRPETQRLLTPEENAFVAAHIPRTLPFAEGYVDKNSVLADKDSYILKPEDSYASNGVFAGVEFAPEEWAKKVEAAYNADYLCQAYCPQYSTENIDYGWGDGVWRSYLNLTGLFVYNGELAGVYARMGEGDIIASYRNERTVPTFIIRGKR